MKQMITRLLLYALATLSLLHGHNADTDVRSNLEIVENDNVTIDCHDTPGTHATISWILVQPGHGNVTICNKNPAAPQTCLVQGSPYYDRVNHLSNTSISIQAIMRNESGDYVCRRPSEFPPTEKVYRNITVVVVPGEATVTGVDRANEGDPDVNLRCLLSVIPNGTLTYRWQKEGTPGNIEEKQNNPVYRIETVSRGHNGSYRCQAENIAGDNRWSDWAVLNVFFVPDSDPVIEDLPERIYEDEPLTFTCRVDGGNPLADLSWSPNCPKGLAVKHNKDEVTRVTTSTLNGTANRAMNQASCSCIAKHQLWQNDKESSPITLEVYYPPDQPSLTPTPSMPWLENRSHTISCVAEDKGNPKYNYRWYRGGQQVGQTDTQLSLTVSKDDNNDVVNCTLTNEYTQHKGITVSQTVRLNVEYLPRVTVTPASGIKKNENDTDLQIRCEADSNPTAINSDYRWTLGPNTNPIHTGQTLNLGPLTKDDSGQYKCNVTVQSGTHGFLEGTGTTSLTVQYLHMTHASTAGVLTEGDKLDISCAAAGQPPEWIFLPWTHTGKYVGTKQIGKETPAEIIKYTVDNVNYTHTGNYTCRVNSNHELPHQQRDIPVTIKFPPKNKTHREEGEKIFTEFGHDKTMEITVFAYPEDVVFTWFIQSVNNSNFTRIEDSNGKFHIATSGLMSTLTVFNITVGELTNYTVHANNSVLQGSGFKFELAARGCPTPASVDVIMPTAVSLTISWRPGFNGGFSQTVYVNLCNASTDLCETKDTLENPEYDTPVATLVLGLQDNTRYKIKIESHNEYDVHNDGTGCTVTTKAGTHRTKEKPVVGGEKFTVIYKDNRAELSWDLPSSPGSYTHQEMEQKEKTTRRRRQVDRCQPPSCHVVPKGQTNLTVPVEPGKKYTFTLVLYDGDIPVYSVSATEDKEPGTITPGPQSSVGAIAGGVAGGLLGIIVIVIVVVVFLKRKELLGKGGSDGVNRWLMRKSKDQNGGTTNPAFSDTEAHGNSEGAGPYSEVGSSQTSLAHAGPVDDGTQLYAQPDKGKKNKKKQQGAAGGAAAAPELYAEVNKKGKKAAQAEGPVLYAEVNKKGKAPTGDVYAEVKKGKKKDELPEVYAEVNKKGGKKDKKDKKKGKKGKDEPEPTLYENIPKNTKGQKKKAVGPTGTEYEDVRGAYANMSRGAAGGLPEDEGAYSEVQARLNPDTEITSPPPGSDGLTYMELEIRKKPRDSVPKPVIAPKPDATVYADIDLTRRVDPLPPDPPPSDDNQKKGQGQ